MRSRRALSVGLGSFAGQWKAFPFVAQRVEAVTKALANFGYSCATLDGAQAPSAASVAEAIWRAAAGLTPDDVLLVHILSHGVISEKTDELYVVGADGEFEPGDDVGRWMRKVADSPGLPHMLFLLDICHAGKAARPRWHIDDDKRGWVIAACAPDEPAFNGRFTEAVANVLDRFARSDVEFDPSRRHIPLETFARAVRREVKRLSEARNGYRQEVTGSLLDITADVPDLPFFPNQHPATDPRVLARPQVDPAVAPFLDEVDEALDAAHFIERAAGHGELPAQQGVGCFSGRRHELRLLSEWFDGYDDRRLIVVTGSPGVGKSALVGVAVCAAHPKLREPTHGLWARLDRTPHRNSRLVAVHARQRDLSEIVASIQRQLSLDPQGDVLEQLGALDEPPVIVIDALDEAERYAEVLDRLLLPLASGTPACRLLIAMRPWAELGELRGLAEAGGGLIDLDTVAEDVLRRDIEDYIRELLRYQAPYGELAYVGARETFASAVAHELTRPREEEQRWGAFLVAGLYTYHLLSAHEPISDPARASELGSRVPLTLPALLELELKARGNVPWLRPLLVALAHARGEGMPVETASRAAQSFAPSGMGVAEPAEIAEAMRVARFYLRRSADVDGTTLYRLFHQGLSDYLCEGADASGMLAAMLAPIGVAGSRARRWDLAEPYLRRHAVQHCSDTSVFAGDLEFLVYADPVAVTALLETDPPVSWLDSETHQRIGTQIVERRYGLARLALRAGEHDVAAQLTEALPWRPLWTVAPKRASGALHLGEGSIEVGFARVSGATTYVFTWVSGSYFSTWEFGPGGGGRMWTVALTEPVTRVEVVSGFVFVNSRSIHLGLGTPGAPSVAEPGTEVSMLAAHRVKWVKTEQGEILVVADETSGIRLYKGYTRTPLGLIQTGGTVAALDCVADAGTLTVVALWGEKVVVHSWLLRRHVPGDPVVLGGAPQHDRIACFKWGSRLVVLTGGPEVLAWEWPRPPSIGDSRERITAVACDPDGRYAATATARGAIVVHDTANGDPVGTPFAAMASALGFAKVRGRTMLLVGTHTGEVGAWDVERNAWATYHFAAHDGAIGIVSVAEMGSGAVLLSASGQVVHLTDFSTGGLLLDPSRPARLPKGALLEPDIEVPRLGAPVESCAKSANGDVFVIIEGEATYLRAM
ncbi:NACHT domain-containing protein [Allorhizocola rhizosphaerae]|uniref:NACHT domain-containing protein n=1 Tax=Allorhizocola rhizosphaerae TaxID=1872709 RepID=UPI000E3D9AB6|nr:NACHT domain-containing protein [Allorhizocola rhizosphaerae]